MGCPGQWGCSGQRPGKLRAWVAVSPHCLPPARPPTLQHSRISKTDGGHVCLHPLPPLVQSVATTSSQASICARGWFSPQAAQAVPLK